jgi:succinate dehydrogenase / fumarate reductase, cytochrome b subunit
MSNASGTPRERPLSPHVQVWRWHVTMACSILHRISGVGLYVGALILAGWAIALALGPDAYADYKGLLASIPGQAILFLLTAGAVYHLVNGIRHLVWDAGAALNVKSANASAWFVLAFTAAATLALWAAYWMGIV